MTLNELNELLAKFKQWPGHDTHFHCDFWAWLHCPQTCVEEVQEFFSKI